MSEVSETTIPMKRRVSSDTESLDEHSERSASSEPLIESSKRAKRSHSIESDAEPSTNLQNRKKVKKTRPWWKLYAQELNDTIGDATTVSRDNRFSKSVKGVLQIGASHWNAEEREVLYRALGRVGRDDTRRLSDLIETKSSLEIEVFLRILQRASDETAIYDPTRYVRLSEIPAASEIDQDLERSLEQSGDAIAYDQDERQAQELSEQYGEIYFLDKRMVEIIDSDDFEIGNHLNISDPIAPDAATAIDLFKLKNFLGLSRYVFMNSCDPQQNFTTFAEDEEQPSLHLTAAVDFYRIVRTLTAEIFLCAHHCALTRIRNRDEQKGQEPEILENDIFASLEILRQTNRHLRHRGTEHRLEMVRRHNVRVTAAIRDWEQSTKFLTVDSAEWWLRRRLHRLPGTKRKDGVAAAQADLEQACVRDMKEENQIEKLKRRGMDELFNDHEHFIVDVNSGTVDTESREELDPWSEEDRDQELMFAEEEQEAAKEAVYVKQLDAYADAQEAKELWKLCRGDPPSGSADEELAEPSKKNKPRRKHRMVRSNWRDTLDYKPEWERYQEPVALQILERTLPPGAIPSAQTTEPDDGEGRTSADEQVPDDNIDEQMINGDTDEQESGDNMDDRVSRDDIDEQSVIPATQTEAVEAAVEASQEEIDTNMEDIHEAETSDTTSTGSSSSESSSEVSSSSEE